MSTYTAISRQTADLIGEKRKAEGWAVRNGSSLRVFNFSKVDIPF